MSWVDDAFANLRKQLKITKAEQDLAARRHQEIRDVVADAWQLEDHFLTGSYRRETKTKRLRDVDIFAVIDGEGPQAGLRQKGPAALLGELKAILDEKYDTVVIDRMACTIDFGSDEEIMSFDVVPAFKRKGGGWEIPDTQRGWIATNPKRHHELSSDKNAACDGKFVPFVKMVKGANRELGEPVEPSFLLEVMGLELVTEPFGRYQDELNWFFATAAEEIAHDWPDPVGLGPDVNSMSSSERSEAATALREAQQIAETAVWLEDEGKERAAVEEWRKLFGWRMPRP
jgi:Second Messenger Oligonucleotide or Dinucleotide Synthetase domain